MDRRRSDGVLAARAAAPRQFRRHLCSARRAIPMIRGIVTLLLAGLAAEAASASEAVRVENASRPTRCAEEDNVYVKFLGSGITHFTIEARHPAYLAALGEDNKAP